MARPFFNKVLNFLGLEEEKQAQQTGTANDYASSGSYGGGSTYIPESRRAESRPRQTPRSIPAQGGRSNTGARRSYGESEYADRAANTRRSDFESDYSSESRRSAYDWEEPRRTASAPRPRSRFEEEPVRTTVSAPKPRPIVRQSRTVMRTLTTLEDCCDIIDELINNTTIVLTMGTEDDHTLQRAVDTLSGAVFALHATIRKASETTYLLAPEGVEVNASYMGRERY